MAVTFEVQGCVEVDDAAIDPRAGTSFRGFRATFNDVGKTSIESDFESVVPNRSA